MLSSSAARRPSVVVAACVLANTAVHFAVLAAGKSPYVCVRAVGGLLPARPQHPLQIVFWALCFVPEVWELSALAGQSLRATQLLELATISMFSVGAAATFTENFAAWVIVLVLCCCAHLVITAQIVVAFSSADRRASDPFTRGLLKVMLPIFLLLWFSFPILWFVAQIELVSTSFEFVASALLSILAKYNITAVLVFGSFSEQKAAIKTEIAELDAQREKAENRNNAKRLFMRCVSSCSCLRSTKQSWNPNYYTRTYI
jgi:bacteriorhodopsin